MSFCISNNAPPKVQLSESIALRCLFRMSSILSFLRRMKLLYQFGYPCTRESGWNTECATHGSDWGPNLSCKYLYIIGIVFTISVSSVESICPLRSSSLDKHSCPITTIFSIIGWQAVVSVTPNVSRKLRRAWLVPRISLTAAEFIWSQPP